jgi:hypothetical protein
MGKRYGGRVCRLVSVEQDSLCQHQRTVHSNGTICSAEEKVALPKLTQGILLMRYFKMRFYQWLGMQAAKRGGTMARNAMVRQLDELDLTGHDEAFCKMIREYREKLKRITYA